jgi:hypothetical protein
MDLRKYKGRPAVVMGGAPSLPESLKACPDDAVYISANHHGAILRKVDFIVYVDRLHQVSFAPMKMLLSKYKVPLVSIREEADIVMPHQFDGNSGLQAILFACMLKCDPIIVVGIEMFKGKTYFHDPDAKSSGFTKPEDFITKVLEDLVRLTAGHNVMQIDCNLPFPPYGYPTAVRDDLRLSHGGTE